MKRINRVHKLYREEVLAVCKRRTRRKCRLDWDITAPELRAAWQQGRKDSFYPYGRAHVQAAGEL